MSHPRLYVKEMAMRNIKEMLEIYSLISELIRRSGLSFGQVALFATARARVTSTSIKDVLKQMLELELGQYRKIARDSREYERDSRRGGSHK